MIMLRNFLKKKKLETVISFIFFSIWAVDIIFIFFLLIISFEKKKRKKEEEEMGGTKLSEFPKERERQRDNSNNTVDILYIGAVTRETLA